MRRVIIPSAGGHEKLTLIEEPDPPQPAGRDVLIRVAAAGVSFADCMVRMGLYENAKRYVGWPITPGFEVAGEVLAVGPEVTRVAPSDRVIAVTRFGGYASRLVVDQKYVFRFPRELELAEAAAFPTVYLTAYYALVELCRIRPGFSVLIHSAAGGVGCAALQIVAELGGRGIGVVGNSAKIDVASRMGAQGVIDKSASDWIRAARELAPDGYDVVLDSNGVETLRKSYELLRPTGRLVSYGFATMLPRGSTRAPWPSLAVRYLRTPRFSPLDLCSENKSVLGFNLSALFDRVDLLDEAMEFLLPKLESGRLKVPNVTRYPIERVADAHRALESGSTSGKLVLTFAGA